MRLIGRGKPCWGLSYNSAYMYWILHCGPTNSTTAHSRAVGASDLAQARPDDKADLRSRHSQIKKNGRAVCQSHLHVYELAKPSGQVFRNSTYNRNHSLTLQYTYAMGAPGSPDGDLQPVYICASATAGHANGYQAPAGTSSLSEEGQRRGWKAKLHTIMFAPTTTAQK